MFFLRRASRLLESMLALWLPSSVEKMFNCVKSDVPLAFNFEKTLPAALLPNKRFDT